MTQFKLTTTALACALALPASLQAQEVSLAYFMGPGHHLNASVFTPFAERLETVSDGKMTIRQFPGGALNSVPPQQYSIIRDGVADIGFIVTGFTPFYMMLSAAMTAYALLLVVHLLIGLRHWSGHDPNEVPE